MEEFKIKSYAKSELAMLYFPDAGSKRTALAHLMNWIKRNKQLCQKLQECNYKKSSKYFLPRETQLIVDYLGSP
jgi:hypothetical protein